MKKLLMAVAFALAAAAAPAIASAADMGGAWAVDGAFSTMGIKFSLVCRFTQSGAKFSGPCKDPQQATPNAASGAVNGANVEFVYDTVYMGVNLHMDYKGVVQPNGAISGGIDTGTVQGTFTAARTR
ncbi:MAG TPA: hypothetical protein VME40_02410 [Caulobacteraceae bacterium]|nr:hypothetical protein [Caulobacteraceae bacterium]